MTLSTTTPRRIAYVVKRYPRFSETFIVNEILAHEAAGCEVYIFTERGSNDSHFQPVICQVRAPITYLLGDANVIRADALWSQLQQLAAQSPERWGRLAATEAVTGNEVFMAAVMAHEVLRLGIDHIHGHFATSAATVARLASLFSGVPYTITAHAKDIFHESVEPADLAVKFDGASSVVTVSDFNVEYLTSRFPDQAHKIRRIYNGLDLRKFEFVRPERRPRKILAVGRMVEKKGFDDLVRACALLLEAGVDFECEIVGGGECFEALRQQVDELQLGDVINLMGPRPLSYVQEAMRKAAVFACPCVTASTGDRDGLPTVLLEAMAWGTPVVATSVTGIPEIVKNERTGLLIDERQPRALAAGLQRLLDDEQLRVRLAIAAREAVERDFDIHCNAAKLREVFAESRRTAPALTLAEVG
jgi:glycosyltransferase involved in cell wall biosynthesis